MLPHRDQENCGSKPGGWSFSKDTDPRHQDSRREKAQLGRTEECRAGVSQRNRVGKDGEQRHLGGHRNERAPQDGSEPEAQHQISRSATGKPGDPNDRPEERGSRLPETPHRDRRGRAKKSSTQRWRSPHRRRPRKAAQSAVARGRPSGKRRAGHARSPRTIACLGTVGARPDVFVLDLFCHGLARHHDGVPR